MGIRLTGPGRQSPLGLYFRLQSAALHRQGHLHTSTPAMANKHGHQLFLASSEVLQHVLLPCLSAADLLRLGLTCKPLLSWVLSTPPKLWQVIPTADNAQHPASGLNRVGQQASIRQSVPVGFFLTDELWQPGPCLQAASQGPECPNI